MTKYEEIAGTLGSYCEALWKERDQMEGVALGLRTTIVTLGGIPEDRFGFATAMEEFNEGQEYSVRDACTLECGHWAFHYYLKVLRGNDLSPIVYYHFTVYLAAKGRDFLAKLVAKEIKREVLIELDDAEKGLVDFGNLVLEECLEYFKELAANPSKTPERTVHGFAPVK